MSSAQKLQGRYYARTASAYDRLHVAPGDEHYRALEHISWFIGAHGWRSLLDVGTGTGRALLHLRERHPDLELRGIEPVEEMAERAAEKGVPRELIVIGSGEELPFDDGSFDAVCELGVLHHVPRPRRVIAEMTRVARRAVLLSDDNRFGFGPYPLRVLKLAVHRAGLWRALDLARTRGRGYRVSDDDGVHYSYSVYDDLGELAEWADRVAVIPTERDRDGWSPLLSASHVLVCAVRDS